MMYTILNKHYDTQDYLISLGPPLVGNTMKYPLRNQSDIQAPTFRIKWHQNSLFHAGIKLWNERDASFKHENMFSFFKALLVKRKNPGTTEQVESKKVVCFFGR